METYKLFTKEPIKDIENIILHKAFPLALERLADNLKKSNSTITRGDIIKNIPLFIFNGMILLRRKDEEGKKLYELFHGCILDAFLNGIEPSFQHDVFYPENDSYDFLIMKYPRGKKADFKPLPNKKIYKNGTVFKIELAELTQLKDLEKIIADKSRDRKRILLLSIAFNGKINFQDVFKKASSINKNNFETIWLIGQINHPENKNKLCYFIAELVKHKEVYPLFELLIDWSKIENELMGALRA